VAVVLCLGILGAASCRRLACPRVPALARRRICSRIASRQTCQRAGIRDSTAARIAALLLATAEWWGSRRTRAHPPSIRRRSHTAGTPLSESLLPLRRASCWTAVRGGESVGGRRLGVGWAGEIGNAFSRPAASASMTVRNGNDDPDPSLEFSTASAIAFTHAGPLRSDPAQICRPTRSSRRRCATVGARLGARCRLRLSGLPLDQSCRTFAWHHGLVCRRGSRDVLGAFLHIDLGCQYGSDN
jgi:hypothetical protein